MDHSTLQNLRFTTAAFYETTICYKRSFHGNIASLGEVFMDVEAGEVGFLPAVHLL